MCLCWCRNPTGESVGAAPVNNDIWCSKCNSYSVRPKWAHFSSFVIWAKQSRHRRAGFFFLAEIITCPCPSFLTGGSRNTWGPITLIHFVWQAQAAVDCLHCFSSRFAFSSLGVIYTVSRYAIYDTEAWCDNYYIDLPYNELKKI